MGHLAIIHPSTGSSSVGSQFAWGMVVALILAIYICFRK